MTERLLVTGADGFIGRRLCGLAEVWGWNVVRIVRDASGEGKRVVVPDISRYSEWPAVLDGVDAVVHLAAIAHVTRGSGRVVSEELLSQVNIDGAVSLFQAARQAGVRRFVFLSSVAVNGTRTHDRPFSEWDMPAPEDGYGRTKLSAEQALLKSASASTTQLVIVRPPLVFGPNPKGNVSRLLRLLDLGIPLPLASIDNRRSVIGLDNLCAALRSCVEAPAAAGQTFLVAEDRSRSTPEILRTLASAMGIRNPLFRCPVSVVGTAAAFSGYGAEFQRISGSLELDSSKIRRLLGWREEKAFEAECEDIARLRWGKGSGTRL